MKQFAVRRVLEPVRPRWERIVSNLFIILFATLRTVDHLAEIFSANAQLPCDLAPQLRVDDLATVRKVRSDHGKAG